MKEELIEQIKPTPLFEGFDLDDLKEFMTGSPYQLRNHRKGAIIAHKGDDCINLTMLVKGTVHTTMSNQEGKEMIIDTYDGPTILAAAFVFSEVNKFPVNVVAQSECTVLYIDRATFIGWLHHDKQLMFNYISIISNRCQHLGRLLNDVALLSLKERVTEYLKVHKKIKNVEALSRFMGVARTSLSRVLSELKAEGMIERTTDGIELRKIVKKA